MADQTYANFAASRSSAGALLDADGITIVRSGTTYKSTMSAVATYLAAAMAALTPQFTAIELGHATDTTITRSGAGRIAVEGNDVIMLNDISTSAALRALITDETGSGALVFATSPTLVTPALGVASATSINKVAITAPATGSTLTIADGKTLTVSGTITFTATDGSTLAIGTGGTLGTAAYKATGTSGNAVPLLDGANTWSRGQVIDQATDTYTLSLARSSGDISVRMYGSVTSVVNFYMGDTGNEAQGGLQYGNSSDTLYLRAGNAQIVSIVAGNVTVATTGVPFNVNSTNSNALKLGFLDNGSVRGYMGADATYSTYLSTSGGTTCIRITNSNGLVEAMFDMTVAGDLRINGGQFYFGGTTTYINYSATDQFDVVTASATRMRIDSAGLITANNGLAVSGGMTSGSPTGGNKGNGTINATAVYDDNVLLTDLVLDMAVAGTFDRVKYAKHPVANLVQPWWFDADQYAEFWKANRYLPGMISWLDEAKRPSTGEVATRLTAVAETHAVLLANDNDRIKALQARVAELEAKLAA